MVNFLQQYQSPTRWIMQLKLARFFTSPGQLHSNLFYPLEEKLIQYICTRFNFNTRTSFRSFHPTKIQFEHIYNKSILQFAILLQYHHDWNLFALVLTEGNIIFQYLQPHYFSRVCLTPRSRATVQLNHFGYLVYKYQLEPID